jgi:RimJ/RimL family protein N-acetyltransferase
MSSGRLIAPPIVETARLVLCTPKRDDAGLIFERYASDERVTRFLAWPTHRTVADTERFLAFATMQWEREGAGPYLIWAGDDGRLLGSTGLELEPGRVATTGYVLAADSWGRGYASEALCAVIDVARDIGVRRLKAVCHPEHRASRHVLEKCGFARDTTRDLRVVFPNLAAGVLQDAIGYGRDLNRHDR